jgi:hypothetical protein
VRSWKPDKSTLKEQEVLEIIGELYEEAGGIGSTWVDVQKEMLGGEGTVGEPGGYEGGEGDRVKGSFWDSVQTATLEGEETVNEPSGPAEATLGGEGTVSEPGEHAEALEES